MWRQRLGLQQHYSYIFSGFDRGGSFFRLRQQQRLRRRQSLRLSRAAFGGGDSFGCDSSDAFGGGSYFDYDFDGGSYLSLHQRSRFRRRRLSSAFANGYSFGGGDFLRPSPTAASWAAAAAASAVAAEIASGIDGC